MVGAWGAGVTLAGAWGAGAILVGAGGRQDFARGLGRRHDLGRGLGRGKLASALRALADNPGQEQNRTGHRDVLLCR